MISKVLAGVKSIRQAWKWSENPGEDLLTDDQWQEVSDALGLSYREAEVCRLLFEGRTRDNIKDELGLKSSTVRQYMENIHRKLRVNNRVGVVLRVVQVRDALRKTKKAHKRPMSK